MQFAAFMQKKYFNYFVEKAQYWILFCTYMTTPSRWFLSSPLINYWKQQVTKTSFVDAPLLVWQTLIL